MMLRVIEVYSLTLHTYHFYVLGLLLRIFIYQGIHRKTDIITYVIYWRAYERAAYF